MHWDFGSGNDWYFQNLIQEASRDAVGMGIPIVYSMGTGMDKKNSAALQLSRI